MDFTAYNEGKRACKSGQRKSACPYDKSKPVERLDWLQGYADQAKDEADKAKGRH